MAEFVLHSLSKTQLDIYTSWRI